MLHPRSLTSPVSVLGRACVFPRRVPNARWAWNTSSIWRRHLEIRNGSVWCLHRSHLHLYLAREHVLMRLMFPTRQLYRVLAFRRTEGGRRFVAVDFAARCALALGFVSTIQLFFFDWCPAVGPSMQPLIHGTGDLLLFKRVSSWLRAFGRQRHRLWPLRRGDVVIATSNGNDGTKVCKRVIALPNDVVVVTRGDGSPQQICFIPKGHVWLQGDNACNSCDSRHYGPVPESQIMGRVLCRIWPLWSFRWINTASTPWDLQVQLHAANALSSDHAPPPVFYVTRDDTTATESV